MICKKCGKGKHYKCKNGGWKLGSRCDCQHRVQVSQGYLMFLIKKYGSYSVSRETEEK